MRGSSGRGAWLPGGEAPAALSRGTRGTMVPEEEENA